MLSTNRPDLLLIAVKGLQRFIQKESLQDAVARVTNATLAARQPHIWGEGSVACASDSRKFATRGENLKTAWHARYRGRGLMVYWHAERRSLAIFSQVQSLRSLTGAAGSLVMALVAQRLYDLWAHLPNGGGQSTTALRERGERGPLRCGQLLSDFGFPTSIFSMSCFFGNSHSRITRGKRRLS